jgi:hypothetical protein
MTIAQQMLADPLRVRPTLARLRAGLGAWVRPLTAAACLAAGALEALPTPAAAQFFYQPFSYRWHVEPDILTPREIAGVVREAGFSRLSRPEYRGDVYVVDATDVDRSRVRLIVDAYNGHILRTIALARPERPRPPRDVPPGVIELPPRQQEPRRQEPREAARPPRDLPPREVAPERAPRPAPPVAVAPRAPGGAGTIERSMPPRLEGPAALPPAVRPAPRQEQRQEQPTTPRTVRPPAAPPPAANQPAQRPTAPSAQRTAPAAPSAVTPPQAPVGSGTREAPRRIEITPPAPLDEARPGRPADNAPINSVPPATLD